MDLSPMLSSRGLAAVCVALVVVACSPEPTRVIELPDAQFAKGGGGATSAPTVTSTSPSYGKRGEHLTVRVFGTGFNATSEAAWERGGVVDPRITVLSTTLVSSTEVVADVQIADDADLVLYDVAVTITLIDGGRKKGVGIEKFVVTSATALPQLGTGNNSIGFDITDAGQVAGRSNGRAFFWDPALGIEDLGSGQVMGITEAATTLVGTKSVNLPQIAVVWTGGAHNWTTTGLSTACLTNVESSIANSIARDGSLIGGEANTTISRKQSRTLPIVWDGAGAVCRVLALPSGSDAGRVHEVNELGMAAGASEGRAVVWDAAGVPTVLAPVPGDDLSFGLTISPNGMIVAGLSGDRPAFWVRNGAGWSVAVPLMASCPQAGQRWARGVNDHGVIVGADCVGARWWRVANGAVVESGSMPRLSTSDAPIPEAITNNTGSGQPWAAGGGPATLATYWLIP